MNLTPKAQKEWRTLAMDKLYPSFKILNPMRRNFRDDEFQSQNEIVSLDKTDIIESDILLVNATKPSWGTAMEIIFAFMNHKAIICFTGTKDHTKISPWVLYHSTRICETLDDAIKYIKVNF